LGELAKTHLFNPETLRLDMKIKRNLEDKEGVWQFLSCMATIRGSTYLSQINLCCVGSKSSSKNIYPCSEHSRLFALSDWLPAQPRSGFRDQYCNVTFEMENSSNLSDEGMPEDEWTSISAVSAARNQIHGYHKRPHSPTIEIRDVGSTRGARSWGTSLQKSAGTIV